MAARKQQCQISVYSEVKYSRWYSDGRNQTYLCLSLFMAAIWSVDLIWWLGCENINPFFLLSWESLKLHRGCCGWLGICISPPRGHHAGERQWDFPTLWARRVSGKGKVLPCQRKCWCQCCDLPFIVGWIAMQGVGIFVIENLEILFW